MRVRVIYIMSALLSAATYCYCSMTNRLPFKTTNPDFSILKLDKTHIDKVRWNSKDDMSQLQRALYFWRSVAQIYSSYKLCKLESFLTRRSKEEAQEAMQQLHDVNSDRLVEMCIFLKGFYVKTGQFLGTRYDFMPRIYCEKLATLSDSVPPMPAELCKEIIEQELGGEISDHFTELNLDNVLGAASIAQVHKGIWKATGDHVAVKLQYPRAEKKMKEDLKNIRALAEILQKTDLKFDVLSAIKELQSQIRYEFDFKREAKNMDLCGSKLRNLGLKDLVLPKSVTATDRVLVMSYVPGINLSRLKEMKITETIPLTIRRNKGAALFEKLAAVYGAMFFYVDLMHADPNPGNISLNGGKIGLLDWGQVKEVSSALKRRISNLIIAFNARDRELICDSLLALGVKVTHPEDRRTVEAIAVTMLDTREMEGFPCDPFDPKCASISNPITKMPADIYFVVRSVQMLRGLAAAFHLSDFSLAQYWGEAARKFADKEVLVRADHASRSKA